MIVAKIKVNLLDFDADWAACANNRRSITGFCVFLGDALVSWKSKKQGTLFRSSTEDEYTALATTCCEMVRLLQLLVALHIDHYLSALYTDSKSASSFAVIQFIMNIQNI